MVNPMTEEAARAALFAANSDASNPALYAAERRERGWLFGWRLSAGPVPMGTASWIVADDGRVRRLGFRERADDALAPDAGQA